MVTGQGVGFGTRRLINNIIETNWGTKEKERKFTYNELLFVIQELKDEEGKEYLTKTSINHGFYVFRDFVELLLYRNLANYDSMILLTSDKGCITGDALLEMPRDLKKYPKGIPLKELEGKGPQYVYSFNIKTQKLELKKCDGVEYVKTCDVYEIELTNGMKLKCTNDHPFLQTNGKYKQLKDLFWQHYDNNIDNLELCTYSQHSKIHYNGNLCEVGTKYKNYKRPKCITRNGSIECCDVHKLQRIQYLNDTKNKKEVKEFLENAKKIRAEANKLQNGGVIKSIKYIGIEKVYDVVNVQDNHNFIVNGFVVSNTGKSSAAIMLARAWCRLIGIKFNPARHIAYSNADVMSKIDMLNKFEPIICDEAIRFASSEDWAKKESKELKKKLGQVRTKHLLYILCFPLKIQKVEKTYLESFTNYWCLSGDTNINIKYDNKNRNLTMQELSELNEPFEVLSYNEKNKQIEYKKNSGCILTKKNAEIYELELENGELIKATEDHEFLTNNGYKKLIDLQEDDLIVCN